MKPNIIEIKNHPKERAILIALSTGHYSRDQVEEHLDELELLTATAGADTVFKILQDRNNPDPAFFIGKGKAEELSSLVCANFRTHHPA